MRSVHDLRQLLTGFRGTTEWFGRQAILERSQAGREQEVRHPLLASGDRAVEPHQNIAGEIAGELPPPKGLRLYSGASKVVKPWRTILPNRGANPGRACHRIRNRSYGSSREAGCGVFVEGRKASGIGLPTYIGMTLAIYTHTADGTQDSALATLAEVALC